MQVENQIVLKPEKKTSVQKADLPVTLSGYVKNQKTGEALIGSTIYITELQTGTTTNGHGYYSITVPKGNYTIKYSFVGFKDFVRAVSLGNSIQSDLMMEEDIPELQQVIITDDYNENPVSEIQVGKLNMSPVLVEQRPAFFGELDVIKSLESVPGVKMHSDGSTFYSVRGGNRDQNLVMIDDAPIYNPSHLLGLFSTVIPDAVNDVNLYMGDMPASLGGRLSSVLDIRTKKGNDQHFQAWGNFGLISTKLGIEGPFKKSASSYLLSTRISRLRWIAQVVNSNIKQFNFADITAKVNVKLNASNRVFLSFYSGGDNYFANNEGIAWQNTALTIQWNRIFSEKLFMNTTFSGSNYDYFLHTNVDTGTKWNSKIANLSVKSDFSYFASPESEISFGTGIQGYGFNPGNIQSSTVTNLPSLSVRNSVELFLYGNHEVQLNEKWGLNYGLRLTSWANNGDAFEFTFDENRNVIDTSYYAQGETYKRFGRIEPRATVNRAIDENSSLKFSYAKNVQNIHLISNSISPFTSLEVWLPSSINIQPEIADQVTLGYYRNLSHLGASFTSELFYKKMKNQIDYAAHAETLLNPQLEGELRFGEGVGYGIELLAKKDAGRLRGWAGYTYARSKRQFDEINEGRIFNSFYDRPHQIDLMASYDLTLRWNIGMNWVYTTGAPYSAPISFYNFNGEEVPIYGQRNNARLPDYHRLDVSAKYKLNRNPEKKYQHELSFSIFNFYARKNILFVNFHKTKSEDGDLEIPANVLEAQRLTTQFYLFQFTPSISYNFRWR
ncbi:MAG TPA: TonB-dependent receptor, partial [Chryseosolibacter sp.]